MRPETAAVFVKGAEPIACGCTNVVWHVIFCMYFMYVGMYVAYVSCIYMITCLLEVVAAGTVIKTSCYCWYCNVQAFPDKNLIFSGRFASYL